MSTSLKDKYGLTEAEAVLAAHRIRLGGEEEPVVGKILSDRVGQAAVPAAPNTAPANYVENAAELAAVARRKAEDQASRAEGITAKAEELTAVPPAREVGTAEPDPTEAARAEALASRDAEPSTESPTGEGENATAGPGLPPSGFDPGEHTIEEVQRHIDEHLDEAQAVLALEVAGKNRPTLVSWFAAVGVEPEDG